MHLVGFIIRIYHDARSSERQMTLKPLQIGFCTILSTNYIFLPKRNISVKETCFL
jgi:hypothetical protein